MVLILVPFFFAVLLLVSGCAHFQRNTPLISGDPSTGYRYRKTSSPTHSPDLLLCVLVTYGGRMTLAELRVARAQGKEAIFVPARSSGRDETDDFANHKYL